MATPTETAATARALGPVLLATDLVRQYVTETAGEQLFSLHTLAEDPDLRMLSEGQRQVIYLAELLYHGYSPRFSLAALIDTADDETWRRCIEAITIRRGLAQELHIPAGQWIPKIGGHGNG